MSLSDWARNKWLVEHTTSPDEIAGLLGVADHDLQNCRVQGLSDDWRLAIAYNAALQCAIAALAASGYRAARDAHHFRTIQSLSLTVGWSDDLIRRLDKFRKKRNISAYERAGEISAAEADEMEKMARDLREEAEAWLRANYPQLLPAS